MKIEVDIRILSVIKALRPYASGRDTKLHCTVLQYFKLLISSRKNTAVVMYAQNMLLDFKKVLPLYAVDIYKYDNV